MPSVSLPLNLFQNLGDLFYNTFIDSGNYKLLVEGLEHTVIISVFAAVLGLLIGVLVAIGRVYHAQTGRLWLLDKLFGLYLTVIRGTPVLLQLMILYFYASGSFDNAVVIAILGFGINSGAYVAEIVRAGILSIDPGQTEAGRSLGLSAGATMRKIVLPQAVKNILPALGNELITLVKETSVAGLITVVDLTRAGDLIRAATLEGLPLFFVGGVYLVLVLGISAILRRIERRLHKSDRG